MLWDKILKLGCTPQLVVTVIGRGAYKLYKLKRKANLHIIILKYLFNTYIFI